MITSATYLLQTRPQALSGAELAKTRWALRRFVGRSGGRSPSQKSAALCERSMPVGLAQDSL
jgi:hypothetical protein